MTRSKTFLSAVLGCCLSINASVIADTVTMVDRPPIESRGSLYVSNKPPLAPNAFCKLPIGSIKPGGWLLHQLQLEADGMTGHLQEISPWCNFEGNAWTDPNGKGTNGWEEVPYWIRGFGDLGYVLNDQRIIGDAKKWINAIFAAQAADGWFGPAGLRTSLNGKPDMWPHMPVLNALQSYYEFTGDPRVITLMTRYFKWQLACPDANFFTGYWDRMRVGDNIESVYWLYNRTGESWLLELATKIHKHSANWAGGMPNWHNVNIAEGFREPATYALQSHDASLTAATVRDYQTVMDQYGQVPGGGFGGDENCRQGYHDPRQGFETCGIVEFMHSFELLTRFTGDPIWADRNEELAFNSLPAALTPDLKALHYLTAPNQVQLDKDNKAPGIDNSGTMFSYSPYGVYRCCQHNHGMGWPYYAEELWAATQDGGLCALLYCASDVTAKVGDGTPVTIDEATDYPFGESVALKIATAKSVEFPLYLRVPRWCQTPAVAVNGHNVSVQAKALSYIVIDRTWNDGDTVTLTLPMKLNVRTWHQNQDSVSIDYGPLTFALDIGMTWTKYGGSDQWLEFEVRPATAWNYGLVLNSADPTASFSLSHKDGAVAAQPFTPDTTPIAIHARARKIEQWSVDRHELLTPLQLSPVKSDAPVEDVRLIPMGAARLRISAFPVIGEGIDAHEWSAPDKPFGLAGQATVSASFVHDDLESIRYKATPSSSNDQSIPRLTWWDHRGTDEWVQYDFTKSTGISSAELYWFDDTGTGQCRVPASWQLLYRDGDDWKPVQDASAFGVQPDTFNHTTFRKVTTTGLRVQVKLQEHFSGGILQWRVSE
jgi:Beta-L-arabinofuranosidase, GH127